jgi:Sulfate permease family
MTSSVLEWLWAYRKAWLRYDVIAGLTAAAVVIPKAMAYATIAGLPVQVGLYTALVPMVIYALVGTSRPLSVSTTTTLAILSAAALGKVVPDGDPAALMIASATLTLLVGLVLVLAGILRLGFVANFISEPVLKGFIVGLALTIMVSQLLKLFGIEGGDERGFSVAGRRAVSAARTLADGLHRSMLVQVLFVLVVRRLEVEDHLLHRPGERIGRRVLIAAIDNETVVPSDVHARVGRERHRHGSLQSALADLAVIRPKGHGSRGTWFWFVSFEEHLQKDVSSRDLLR